ncbi:hypothetical protein WJX84_000523 [Apatococcus fuscideae]|uniref:Uncharacterized protein n=1 Tax=Apatococcus fuscideae TaxID=2026836 RepID=A0AAW1TDJ9_9CHLO
MQFSNEELRAHMQEYLEWSQETFDIEDLVEVRQGLGGLPCVALQHPTGATAQVYLHGANVVSWTMPDGRELLHTMSDNVFDGHESIRGGMPILFPQVGVGRLPRGGFMGDLHWSVVDTAISPGFAEGTAEDPAPSVVLHAQDDPWTMSMYPHEFEALYTVSLMLPDDFDSPESDGAPERIRGPGPKKELSKLQQDNEKRLSEGKFLYDPKQMEARRSRNSKKMADLQATSGATGGTMGEQFEEEDAEAQAAMDTNQLPMQLRCKLDILNKSEREMQFTTSLQSHWVVKDLHSYFPFVRTIGLGGRYMLDSSHEPAHPQLRIDNEDYLCFGRDHVDRVYIDAHDTEVRFCNGTPTHLEMLPRQNFRDLQALSPLMTDPDEAASFVSLGPAEAARTVRLQPGETWSGEMCFRSHDNYWEYPIFEQMKATPYPGYEDDLGHSEIPPGPPGIDQNVPRPGGPHADAYE